MAPSRRLGIRFERWDAGCIRAPLPGPDLRAFWPPKLADDPGFGEPAGARSRGGVFWPDARHVSDPALAAQNFAEGARLAEAGFVRDKVVKALRGERVRGERLADGRELRADVVLNVAGPGSARTQRTGESGGGNGRGGRGSRHAAEADGRGR